MVKRLFYIFLILLTVHIIRAEDVDSFKMSSYEGLHFLVGFMENESKIAEFNKQVEQKIFVSSNSKANLTVTFGFMSPQSFIVPENDVLVIDVPRSLENDESEEIRNKLVEIKSDVPVSVYAFSSIPRSTDSYAAIPIANWGTEYVAVSLPNDQYNQKTLDSIKDFTPRSSQIMIMSAYDNTKVTIIPSSLTRKAKQVGQSYEITLNKGQCYLVQSWQYARGMGDLSGTIVRSDKPVGFLTGHVRTALLQGFVEQPPDSKDHLIEMLMPTSSWGNTFVSVPFGTNVSKGDYFKVVSKDKNVVIDVLTDDDVKQIRFNETTSQILESLNKPALWRSSHPVQLAQFMLRTGDTAETLYYDPSIVVLPPVEQFVSKILFNTPNESFMVIDGSKFLEHYVTIVVQPEALPSLKLDNDLVINISNIQEQTIPGTDLKWARIKLDAGKHELFSPDGRFAGVLFGVGRFDSYAMTLGCSLQNPFTEDDKPPTISVVEECGKIAGTITDEISDESYGIYYAFVQTDSTINYKWKIDEIKSDAEFITFTAEPIDKFKDGKFVIDYIDKGGNRNRYTYIYDAINIEYPNEIFLSNMDYNDSVCFEIKLKNKGKRSIDFLSSSVTSDSRIKLYNSLNLPEVFKSDEEIILNLCITPRGDTSGIYGKIYLDFACDVKIEIPFRGTLVALELVVDNIDFGEVQIGNESCDSITVTNLGNAEVLITGSEFNDIFQIDTTEYFPILLQPGESIFLKVCFNPTDRLNYIDSILFSNDYRIELIGTIKGIGVAPDVNSLVYDFGKFRVGSLKNLEREFINSGNQFAEINFDKFSYQSHTNDEISEKLDGIIDLIINPNNIHKLELGLTPIDTLDYSLQALYNTNWDLHPALTLTVNAKGTIPVIQTKNVNFGNIRIFDEVESNETIVLSKGNETLTIDSIIPFSGDFDSFIMDYTQLHNLSILENGELNYLIKFSPKKLGYHELILAVIHDAMPNFLRDTSYISITGNAIQPDSYNVDITIDDNKVESCRFTERKISIKNNGNKIHLTDLILEKSPEEFDAKILNFVPVEIENGETVEFIVRIFTQRDKIGKLKVIAKIFEIDSLVKEFDIIPVSGEIILDEIPEIQYAAGDTIDVTISGKFNANIDTLTSFYLTLNINSDYLLLKNDIFSLKMNNFGDISKYNLNISKTKDKLVFYISEDLINIFDNLNWSVDLRFLGLLSDQISGNWKINVSSDDCFIPAEGNLKTKLDSVCVFDVRHVFIDKNNSHINIYPNPVNDIIRLKTITNIEIYDGKISLTDNLGINYNLAENVFIEKGTGYLEYDVSNLSSGTYILNFESKNLTKNILFVIIR